jgi:hypothetical protein
MVGGTNWFYGGVSKFVPPLYLLGEVQKDIFVALNENHVQCLAVILSTNSYSSRPDKLGLRIFRKFV